MMIKSRKLKLFLFGYTNIVIILIFFIFGIFVGANWSVAKKAAYLLKTKVAGEVTDEEVDFDIYWDVFNAIKDKYIDRPVNEKDLFYASLAGLAAGTGDPYTNFFDPQLTEQFNQEINGTFRGIGIEIGIKNKQLVVISPLKNTPADKAGLIAKDIILKIDDTEASALSLDSAVSLIRGEKGTSVKLTINRPGNDDLMEFDIIRDTIQVQSVTYEKIDPNTAYLEFSMFNTETLKEFTAIANQIVLDKPKAIILDLRNNPGGYFDTAVDIGGFFVENDVVVIEDRPGEKREEYSSDQQAILANWPTVVIVNGGSASAAEILAGALQDHGLATVVGEKTFGKGSVQEIQSFTDGSSLKLTVAKWLTPSGNSIQDNGITPDIEVELTEEDYSQDRDPQLDKAIELLSQ